MREPGDPRIPNAIEKPWRFVYQTPWRKSVWSIEVKRHIKRLEITQQALFVESEYGKERFRIIGWVRQLNDGSKPSFSAVIIEDPRTKEKATVPLSLLEKKFKKSIPLPKGLRGAPFEEEK